MKKLLFILLLVMSFTLCSCNKTDKHDIIVSDAVMEVLEKDGDWLESYEPFYRYDLDEMGIWDEELDKLRIMSKGWYELGEAKEKYNLDKNYIVNLEGLDDMNASASAQFSVNQFRDLANTLREVANGKKIVIIDLREESHCFINGISISVYGLHNWGNLGKTLEEVEEAEAHDFANLIGKTIIAYGRDDEVKLDDILELKVETVISEKELVESEGFEYLRFDCTDHVWPEAEEIDEFINFVKSIDTKNTWLHFHCQGGTGRTGAFMMIYDKMLNSHVSDKDILYRQAMTGSNYPLYLGDGDSYKDPLYAEKAEMAPLIFKYIEENHESNYEISWSQWLKNNN